MADTTADETPDKPKSSKMPLLIGFLLALVGGGGGYFATSSGIFLAPESQPVAEETKADENKQSYNIAFIPMDPLTITLPRSSRYQHLRFRGELEVENQYQTEVQTLMPRIIDVFNSYLRAVEVSDMEETAALTRLRSQMLHRAQIVAGPGRINDLLIMEFVLN